MQEVIHTMQLFMATTLFISVISIVINGFRFIGAEIGVEYFQLKNNIIFNGFGVGMSMVVMLILNIIQHAEGVEPSSELTGLSNVFPWLVVLAFVGGLIYVLFISLQRDEVVEDLEMPPTVQSLIEEDTQQQAILEFEKTLRAIQQKYQ